MELINCAQPWFEMQIEYNERVGCCCYYRLEKTPLNLNVPFSVDKYWNDEKMQEIRKVIASNNIAGTGCEGCQYIRYGSASSFLDIPDSLNQTQKDNWLNALNNYRDKRIIIDSLPVKYYINFGLLCNLKCIMCSQENLRRIDKRLLPAEMLTGLKEHLVVANEIAIIGGEPFSLPNARAFIDTIVSDHNYSNVKLSLFTNGTQLHHYIEKLRSMKRINLCVSLDSIGDAYEKIRRGARWNRTEQNIMSFKETAEKYNLDWTVNIAAVVMKSSIPRLVDFVDWCIKRDFPVHFVPIQPQALQPQGFSFREEIFKYPELLKDIPNWEGLFNEAIEKLTEKSWIQGAVKPLSLMKNEIKARELNLKGEDLFSGGDIEGAMRLFAEAERKDPHYLLTYNNIGVIYWQKGESTTALRYFINVLKEDPNNREATLNCGILLKSMGEFEDAERLCSAYLRNHPDDREITAALQKNYSDASYTGYHETCQP